TFGSPNQTTERSVAAAGPPGREKGSDGHDNSWVRNSGVWALPYAHLRADSARQKCREWAAPAAAATGIRRIRAGEDQPGERRSRRLLSDSTRPVGACHDR